MAVVTIARNATIAKILQPDLALIKFITNLLAYQVDGTGIGGMGNSFGSFYQVAKGIFPAGFVHLVKGELEARGDTVRLIQNKHAEPLGPENPIVDQWGNDDPDFEHQPRALRQVEKHGCGIIQVATGGGKSKIAMMIMARYRRMTLFLTTRGILLHQMDDQLRAIGINTGQIGDGEMRLVRGVNLGMVQTLVQSLEEPDVNTEFRKVLKSAHLSKDYDAKTSRETYMAIAKDRYKAKAKKRDEVIKMLEMIEVVIGEEAHEAGGDSYYAILKHCKNATIRVALTATPFMRDSAADNMRLMAAFGPVLIEVSEDMLIARGVLAQPIFKYIDCPPHPALRRSSPYERAVTLGIIENDAMHAVVVRDAVRAAAASMPVLALVLRKEHGQRMLEAYRAAGLRTAFLKGENDQAERKAQLKLLATGGIDVLLGTTIVDVGVDVPAVSMLQLLGGGKAEVALRQRVGRCLRRKRNRPNFSFVGDYYCGMNSKLSDHTRQRRNIIARTKGFGEHILADGQDFPWHLFETKVAA